jgi:protein phosphatase
MTLALRYAVRSDVGLLREGNEDSAYAGPRLLAVADGMGGHAAGEVASAVAISSLADLDDDMPASELQIALSTAVAHANQILHDMVSADPSIGGMGTTLTAMLWSGSKVALCHIGDSRAYVLSGDEFRQITHDHTLVSRWWTTAGSRDEAATQPAADHPAAPLTGPRRPAGPVDPRGAAMIPAVLGRATSEGRVERCGGGRAPRSQSGMAIRAGGTTARRPR